MTQGELIAQFPMQNSITNRVLLINPELFNQMLGLSVQECRIFLLVTAGQLRIKMGATTTDIEAGQFIDILLWDPVVFIEMSPDLQAWSLFANHVFTTESLNSLKPADSESFKDHHGIPLISLRDNEMRTLEKQFEIFLSALHNTTHIYRTELCKTYFRSFMLEFGNITFNKRKVSDEPEGVENRQDTILRSFLKLVWKYYKTEHNVEFYAQRLCLSSKHLSRVVKDKLGKTPYAVIRDELLQRATFLLTDTKTPVQDISSELHFSEMAAFCKFFKKHNGVSPTAFRAAERKI